MSCPLYPTSKEKQARPTLEKQDPPLSLPRPSPSALSSLDSQTPLVPTGEDGTSCPTYHSQLLPLVPAQSSCKMSPLGMNFTH